VGVKVLWEAGCRGIAPERVVLHATSEEEARESEDRFRGMRAFVVPNGVTVPGASRHVASDGELRLLYFGRLDPIKGLENLLEACARVRKEHAIRLRLAVAGDGEADYVRTLRDRIAVLGIADIVSMHGWAERSEKARFFEQTDVLAVPSYKESFAMVVAEALSHGIPVITSRGTPWKRVEEVGCGLWVVNSPESFASAIVRASGMPLREMGQRGRDWMAREFEWSRIGARMMEVYKGLQVGA
jgi:glycosyltransferase involved in cell wall biosynthesis